MSIFFFQRTSGLGSLGTSKSGDAHLTIGVIVPHSLFQERNYKSAIKKAVLNLNKESSGYTFLKKYKFNCGRSKECQDVEMIMMRSSPSPRGNI